jgi:hypothetical protein
MPLAKNRFKKTISSQVTTRALKWAREEGWPNHAKPALPKLWGWLSKQGPLAKMAIGLAATGGLITVGGEATGTFTPVSDTVDVVAGTVEAKAEETEARVIDLETTTNDITIAIQAIHEGQSVQTVILGRIETALNSVTGRVDNAHPVLSESVGLDCSGQRIPSVTFRNGEIVKNPDQTNAFDVTGASTSARLRIETLTITNMRAPNFTISISDLHTRVVTDTETDGYTLTGTSATTTAVMFSGRTRGPVVIEDFRADHAVLQTTSAECWIGELIIDNVSLSGGDFVGKWLDVGDFTLEDSFIGDGDGPFIADLVIGSTNDIGTSTTTNVRDDSGIDID